MKQNNGYRLTITPNILFPTHLLVQEAGIIMRYLKVALRDSGDFSIRLASV